MKKRFMAIIVATTLLFSTTVNAATTRSSNIKSVGVLVAQNATGQSVKFDSSDLRGLAAEIDNLEASYKNAISTSINIAGDTSVTPNSTLRAMCDAIEGLTSGISDDALQDLINGSGHTEGSDSIPLDVRLGCGDSDHNVHTEQGTWRQEFDIYKDASGNSALLSYINFNIYAAKWKAYNGRYMKEDINYVVKTDKGKILDSGTVSLIEHVDPFNKLNMSCVAKSYSMFGLGVDDAKKIIIEVSWDLQCRTDPGHSDSQAYYHLLMDECNAYYINR